MIKTVCRSFAWASPKTIKNMFVDSQDYKGIGFWYKDVDEQNKLIENKNKTT